MLGPCTCSARTRTDSTRSAGGSRRPRRRREPASARPCGRTLEARVGAATTCSWSGPLGSDAGQVGATPLDVGDVHVFCGDFPAGTGGFLTQQPVATGGLPGDRLGESVALDGHRIVAGAPGFDGPAGAGPGAPRVLGVRLHEHEPVARDRLGRGRRWHGARPRLRGRDVRVLAAGRVRARPGRRSTGPLVPGP